MSARLSSLPSGLFRQALCLSLDVYTSLRFPCLISALSFREEGCIGLRWKKRQCLFKRERKKAALQRRQQNPTDKVNIFGIQWKVVNEGGCFSFKNKAFHHIHLCEGCSKDRSETIVWRNRRLFVFLKDLFTQLNIAADKKKGCLEWLSDVAVSEDEAPAGGSKSSGGTIMSYGHNYELPNLEGEKFSQIIQRSSEGLPSSLAQHFIGDTAASASASASASVAPGPPAAADCCCLPAPGSGRWWAGHWIALGHLTYAPVKKTEFPLRLPRLRMVAAFSNVT
ncbi:hypothetical protein EYF80_000770 [Liparis tanakae]|uniref:Uncharacterized protein n=1 Tax=Liparis tanakae TaxID=230148 RepID=A0A4Z2JI05_9TELE|nr:hypothetical protein EYF80_000770 [Liparis tanakae]